MASLLEILMAQRSLNPDPSAGLLGDALQGNQVGRQVLTERERQRGLLDGAAAEAVHVPDIFNPGQPASIRQLQGSQQAAGGAAPVEPEQLEGAARQAGDAARQESQRQMAAGIAQVTPDGQVPSAAIPYIRETTEDNVNSGPGKPGRGFLGRLYAGERVPGLSDAQNRKLRNNALITAGLAMLGSKANFGQALAGGILLARQLTTQKAGELLDEQRSQDRIRERYATLADSDLTELERWQEVRRRATAEGDLDAAEVAQDVIEDLRDRSAGEAEQQFREINGQTFRVDAEGNIRDPFSGEIVREAPSQEGELETFQTAAGPRTFRVDAEGNIRDPFSGEVVQQAPQAPIGEGGPDEDTVFARTDKLADDFRSELGDQADVANAIAAAANAPANAAGDLTLIQSLIRAQDPGASVREADIRNAKGIGGLPAQTQTWIRHFADRGKMDPTVRAEIREELVRIGRDRARVVQPTVERFQLRASRSGVDPSLFVNPLSEAISILQGEGGAAGGADVDAELDAIFGEGGV